MRSVYALTAVLALAGVAAADSVDLTFTGTGSGRSYNIVSNGVSTSTFAGQLNFSVANGSGPIGGNLNGALLTFCIDVLEQVGAGLNTYEIAALADAPVTAGGIAPAMGADKAAAIARMYTFANGQQFASNNNYAAAFQLAIWEVIADFGGDNPMSLNDGNFLVTSSVSASVTSIVNDLLAAAGDTSIAKFRGLGALTNEGFQDQLYAVVIPLPGAAGLAAVGLAGVGLVARRRRF